MFLAMAIYAGNQIAYVLQGEQLPVGKSPPHQNLWVEKWGSGSAPS
jgi:hypothetical protein